MRFGDKDVGAGRINNGPEPVSFDIDAERYDSALLAIRAQNFGAVHVVRARHDDRVSAIQAASQNRFENPAENSLPDYVTVICDYQPPAMAAGEIRQQRSRVGPMDVHKVRRSIANTADHCRAHRC